MSDAGSPEDGEQASEVGFGCEEGLSGNSLLLQLRIPHRYDYPYLGMPKS